MREISGLEEVTLFTLCKYGQNTTFKIKILTREEYKKFVKGKKLFFFLSQFLLKEYIDFYKNFINDKDYFDDYTDRVKGLYEPELAEYPEIAPLKYLISDDINQAEYACCVTSLKFDPIIPLYPFLSNYLINCCKIFSEIIKTGDMYEYTILLREDLFANLKRNQKIEKLAHESFHIIAKITQRTYTRNQMDKKASEIAKEFKRYHYNKGTLRDFFKLLETSF